MKYNAPIKDGGKVLFYAVLSFPYLELENKEDASEKTSRVISAFNSFYESMKELLLASVRERIVENEGKVSPCRLKANFESTIDGESIIIDRILSIRDSFGCQKQKSERDIFSCSYACFINDKKHKTKKHNASD